VAAVMFRDTYGVARSAVMVGRPAVR